MSATNEEIDDARETPNLLTQELTAPTPTNPREQLAQADALMALQRLKQPQLTIPAPVRLGNAPEPIQGAPGGPQGYRAPPPSPATRTPTGPIQDNGMGQPSLPELEAAYEHNRRQAVANAQRQNRLALIGGAFSGLGQAIAGAKTGRPVDLSWLTQQQRENLAGANDEWERRKADAIKQYMTNKQVIADQRQEAVAKDEADPTSKASAIYRFVYSNKIPGLEIPESMSVNALRPLAPALDQAAALFQAGRTADAQIAIARLNAQMKFAEDQEKERHDLASEENARNVAAATNANAQATRAQSHEQFHSNQERERANKQNDTYNAMLQNIARLRSEPQGAMADTTISRAGRALQILDGAPRDASGNPDFDKLGSEQVALLKTELEAAAKGNGGTEGGRESIINPTLQAHWNKFMELVNNKPSPAQLGAFLRQDKQYLEDIKEQAQKYLDERAVKEFNGTQGITPEQREQWKRDNADLMKRVEERNKPKAQKEPPNGHQTVTQGGHTYTWNAETGKYE